MALNPPTSYTANKFLRLNGVAYNKGVVIPLPVMAGLKHANALVSNGSIEPHPDPHRRVRRGSRPWKRQATTVHYALAHGPNIQREGADDEQD